MQNQPSNNPALRTAGVVFGLLYPTALTWLYFIALAREASAVQQAAYTIGKAIQFGFPAVWLWLFARQRVGLPGWTANGIALGLLFGAAVGGAILAVYHLWLKHTTFFDESALLVIEKLTGIGLLTPAAFIVLGVFYSLAHSLLEEYYWRWFVFGELSARIRPGPAILLSSLGFMAHHVLVVATYFGWTSAATWLFSLAVAIGGAFWAWLYRRSGSLLGSWLSHLLIDAAIFAVGHDLVF